MNSLLVLFLGIAFSQDATAQAPVGKAARVGEQAAEVRAFHAKTTAVIAELPAGTPVRIVAERTPWSRVRVPGGLTVWVHGDYVAVQGSDGRLTSRHVRARPLPSTGVESYPVGKFEKGDAVIVLGREGDWLKVQAPEKLGAWVLTEELVTLSNESEAWQRDWNAARDRRLQAVRPAPPAPKPQPEEPAVSTEEEDSPQPGLAQLSSSGENAAVTQPSTAGAQAAKDPTQDLLRAELELSQFASSGRFDLAQAEELEVLFGSVLWVGTELDHLERARKGLAQLDALRRAAILQQELAEEKARHETAATAAEATATRMAAEPEVLRPAGRLETYTLVGWLEHQPSVNSAAPYSIVRGDTRYAIMSLDGRIDLQSHVGKEVVVRGTWRPTKVQGQRVLEVAELRRHLPRRP